MFQGQIQDLKLGGGALNKIAPSGGRRENFGGISCEKLRFYAPKIMFFLILGGARAGCAPPPGSAPKVDTPTTKVTLYMSSFQVYKKKH